MSRPEQTPFNSASCCNPVDRREFLKLAGTGLTSTVLASSRGAMAGPFSTQPGDAEHFVPEDKKLSPEWVKSLLERGRPEVWSGKALDTIGMPVGGIGAGQLYLTGDGRLASWQIFNHHHFSGHGLRSYEYRTPEVPVDNGFTLHVERADKKQQWPLDRRGFNSIEFLGEYPIARVRYAGDGVPLSVELEAFSPFIPLSSQDSTLPATLLRITCRNTAEDAFKVRVEGRLQNAACCHTREERTTLKPFARLEPPRPTGTVLLQGVHEPPVEKVVEPRPPVLVADFESGTYGDWKATGTALGERPSTGTAPRQQAVSGFEGKGLVNTYLGSDEPQGTLTSPAFKIQRKYINLLVGGGNQRRRVCVNLTVAGKVVRTAAGRDSEKLAWRTWEVGEFEGREAQIEIVDSADGPWGHILADQIEQSDERRAGPVGPLENLYDFGTLALACAGPVSTAGQPPEGGDVGVLSSEAVELAPGGERTFLWVVAWHFPNLYYREAAGGDPVGRAYADRFEDAAQVAWHVLEHADRLTRETRLWRDTYYDSTLPYWLLNRLGSTVSYLATGTSQLWSKGRFWGWEGVGCCEGTCTHVWNYAHALARLFPDLERSIRERQDLGSALHPDGRVGFRGTRNRAYAADGQCGTVLKCYREHLMSPDQTFLAQHWPKIRSVLEFSIRQDADDDGLIENSQHNTFDINFQGPNTFVGSLYLAALRAGEEMARLMNENEFADRLRGIFEQGRKLTANRLWNGEYYIQEVDLKQHPRFQYARGCLADQVFGDHWSLQVGLGHVYPAENVRKALQAVWRYNWTPDVTAQNAKFKPERWFVAPGEAGLFICTWPKGGRPDEPVRYRDEVWTGIEYQVAGHMIWEGMITEALAVVRAIHDRYHPDRHNPYNEVECGDHYARAMASWGVFTALAGYEHDGPRGRLAFAPRISPEGFKTAFTAAEGWGSFSQNSEKGRLTARLELRWGRLRLKTLELAAGPGTKPLKATAVLGDRTLQATTRTAGGRAAIAFEPELSLQPGDTLQVVLDES